MQISDEQLRSLRRHNSFIMRYVFLSHRDVIDTSGNEPTYIWEKSDFGTWDEDYKYLWVPVTAEDAIDWLLI